MSRIARAVVLACACAGCAVVDAQPLTCHATGQGDDVIVEAKAEEGGDGEIRVRAIWRSVSQGGASFDLRSLSPMQAGERLMLDRLLEAAVGRTSTHGSSSRGKASRPIGRPLHWPVTSMP
ncbi:MAG: hypothetical protein IPM12_16235 [Flavobacteriales bacterium]|nr:hypothetical protein [Flavobacteriales bacterium]